MRLPRHCPSQQTVDRILERLQQGGEQGASSRELLKVTGYYHDAITALKRDGYVIVSSSAGLPSPFGSVRRYQLVAEPREDCEGSD